MPYILNPVELLTPLSDSQWEGGPGKWPVIEGTQHAALWSYGSIFFNKLTSEIYSKSPVRAMGKVLLM